MELIGEVGEGMDTRKLDNEVLYYYINIFNFLIFNFTILFSIYLFTYIA